MFPLNPALTVVVAVTAVSGVSVAVLVTEASSAVAFWPTVAVGTMS